MQRISKNYKRVDLLADEYRNKANSFKLNEKAMRDNPKESKLHHFSPEFLQNSGLYF